MHKLIIAIISLASCLLGSLAHAQALRETKARQAQVELLNLNFFHEGRGMMLPPGFPLIGDRIWDRATLTVLKRKMTDDVGVIIQNGKMVGLQPVRYEGNGVGAVGCAVCHTGRAAGIMIPGLGNKNIDIFMLASIAKDTWSAWEKMDHVLHPFGEKRAQRDELRRRSLHFINEVGNPKLSNVTQGLVPIGIIRKWFFDQAKLPMDSLARGQVKVPFFWGYGEKRKVGSFSDGFGQGILPGWAVAVELVAGQTVDGVREYVPKIHHAEDVLGDLLPPKYPFAIDQARAVKGKQIFDQTCAKCHGTYEIESDGYPRFQPPKFVPIEVVKTDPGRLEGVTPFFRDLVRSNPLSDLIQQTSNANGYMAPRLEGAWARFPYLHNASVPTLWDLLLPAAQRPKMFSLKNAGERYRFDEQRLGLTRNLSEATLIQLARQGKRSVYDTSKKEHSNQGHEFSFYGQLGNEERAAIIEYVKTL